jgi:orotate phosphoribosyltransferase
MVAPETDVRSFLRRRLVDVVRLEEAVGLGDKVVPCMIDGRELLLRQPDLSCAARQLWQRLAPYRPDVVAGMTLSADTLVAAVLYEAMKDGVVVAGAIVRKQRKRYGLQKLIEGPTVRRDARVVVVDDLLNYGKTAVQCAEAFGAAGAQVVAVGVLIDYGRAATRRLMRDHGIAVEPLFTMSDMGLAPRLPEHSWRVAEQWDAQFPTPDEATTLQVSPDGKHVVAGGPSWVGLCERTDPAWRWVRELPGARALAGADEVVVVASDDPAGGSRIAALDTATGAEVWVRALPGHVSVGGHWPGSELVLVSTPDQTVALSVADGEVRWDMDKGGIGLAVGPGRFAIRSPHRLRIGDTATGRQSVNRWVGSAHHPLVATDGRAFVTSVRRRAVLSVEPDGTGRWYATLPTAEPAGLAWTGDGWLVSDTGGSAWLLDDDAGAPLGVASGSGTATGEWSPVASDGKGTVWALRPGSLACLATERTPRVPAP